MTVDPDPISDRSRSVDESDLKMLDADEETQSLEDRAEIDSKLVEEFDL